MPTITFPHTFEKGRYKGRTFESQSEYGKTCRDDRKRMDGNGQITGLPGYAIRIIAASQELMTKNRPYSVKEAAEFIQKLIGQV